MHHSEAQSPETSISKHTLSNFAGILGTQLLHLPQLDGIASISIAVVLAVSSLFLAREAKALLVGESALPQVRDSILQIATADSAIAMPMVC